MTKTRQLQARNVKIGDTIEVRGGLGRIEVASKEDTAKGNLRLAGVSTLRPGNRRKRCLQRRSVIVDPRTEMTVLGDEVLAR